MVRHRKRVTGERFYTNPEACPVRGPRVRLLKSSGVRTCVQVVIKHVYGETSGCCPLSPPPCSAQTVAKRPRVLDEYSTGTKLGREMNEFPVKIVETHCL